MSFSSKVKGEICRYVDITKSEALAQISAIMKVSGTIGFSGKGITFRIVTYRESWKCEINIYIIKR